MTIRTLLRSQITEAWHKSITIDYAAQRINSERSLQASLWSNLNALLPFKTRRMFIEPSLNVLDKCRYPDIVICNTREIIAIIELKYLPRGKPTWSKDITTFHWLDENKKNVSITNTRFRGIEADKRTYSLAKNVLYVWAGVHAVSNTSLLEYINPILWPRFLALHAETQQSNPVQLRITSGK